MLTRTKIILILSTVFISHGLDAQPKFEHRLKIENFPRQSDRFLLLYGSLVHQQEGRQPFYLTMLQVSDSLALRKQYEEARIGYQIALPYFYFFRKERVAALYGKLANTFKNDQEWITAISFYLKALAHLDHEKDATLTKAVTYINIAAIFIDLRDYEKAHAYLDWAIPVFQRKGDTVDAAIALTHKARIQVFSNEPEKALALYLAALQLIDQISFDNAKIKAIKVDITNYVVGAYLDLNNTDSALSYLGRMSKDLPYASLNSQTLTQLLYGDALADKKEYAKAGFLLRQSLNIARKENFHNILVAAHRSLANLYSAQGDAEQAWIHGGEYINLQQDLFNEAKENINSINALESKYQLSLKDNKIIQKELLITRQEKNLARKTLWNMTLGFSALVALALAAIILMAYRSYRRRHRLLLQEKEIAQLKAMMKGEENERSRMARELHDGIGGMLAAIKMNLGFVKKEYVGMPQLDKLEELSYMLQDTSSEVRKVAHNLMPDVLQRHNLEDALLLYCSQINKGGALQIDLHCDGALEQLSKSEELVLYRIMQELIQNVVKHARATHAEIQIMQYDNSLSLTVEDNGQGFDVAEHNGGFGLQNLRYRIQALQGAIHLTSVKGKSTTIYIEFDLKKLKFALG